MAEKEKELAQYAQWITIHRTNPTAKQQVEQLLSEDKALIANIKNSEDVNVQQQRELDEKIKALKDHEEHYLRARIISIYSLVFPKVSDFSKLSLDELKQEYEKLAQQIKEEQQTILNSTPYKNMLRLKQKVILPQNN